MRINRNDLCWCNSGKKYKKCHMEFDERIENLAREGFEVPTRDITNRRYKKKCRNK